MSQEIYAQIIDLKSHTDDIKRGRDFESLMREIQPWDLRPPIVSSPKSEQLDGVFIYKGLTYIIESKAVRKKITPGMKEWEDFELKLQRRRDKGVVGMFCCLFDVCETVLERARELNMLGMRTIIISGKTWDELTAADIYFPSFLDYLLLMCTLKNSPSVDSLKNAKSWVYDGKTISDNFNNNAKKISSTFLRRFKHKFHDRIFVERTIDIQIRSLIQALAPQSLKISKTKEGYKQVLIVRDFSGSGKTTLAINLAGQSEHSFCFASTANLSQVDEVLDNFINLNKYPDNGLNELLAVNKPLLFVIDSLDETPVHSHIGKRREIRSLFKKIDELNLGAAKKGLAIFPIVVMFTIREEYWRDWEAAFEGRQDTVQLKKVLAHYSQTEFQDALEKYSRAYDYNILNFLSPEAQSILSYPINLEIFSEANHYEGEITVDDIWEGKILSNYFTKKEESLSKHYISQFSSHVFYWLLSSLAYRMLEERTTLFSKKQFKELVASISSELSLSSDQILLNINSEQIIINDTDDTSNYRFKYIRFIEYLVALHIIQQINEGSDLKIIDGAIQIIYDSNIVSIYRVLDNIKHICRLHYRDIEKEIIDYYSHSDTFLNNYLPELRGKIARGEKIPHDSIKSIITNNFLQSPATSWNTFFIVASKNVAEKKNTIISAFVLAWEKNVGNGNRWKMISRLASRNFLLEERVLYQLFKDSTSREWEEYLGTVLTVDLNHAFLELWDQIQGSQIFNKMVDRDPQEWHLANKLLSLIFRNEGYIIGDMLSDEKPKKYVVFEKSGLKRLPDLEIQKKQACDDYIDEIMTLFRGETIKTNSSYFFVKELTKDSIQYLNIKLESLLNGRYGSDQKPFVNSIFHSAPATNQLIKVIRENTYLEYRVDQVDSRGITVFEEILKCGHEDKLILFDFIFKLGYKQTDTDEKFISDALKNREELNAKEFEDVLIGFSISKIGDFTDFERFNGIYREICVILSAKFNRIVHFKFPNFVQVANNALEHYRPYSALFLRAFDLYGRNVELETKPSYIKKVEALHKAGVVPSHDFDDIFKAIFPELF